MHEFSVMIQIVDSVLEAAAKHDAKRVEEVDLEIGEFTMLGEEQMRFAYEVLAKDTVLQGSKLNIRSVKGRVRCGSCGYEGEMSILEDMPHKVVPVLECPNCHEPAEITAGRECVVRNIRMVVPDV